MPAAAHHTREDFDAIRSVVETVGDAWSWLILREAILHGVERWSELQRNVGLAPKTLANRLGHLCDGGLLQREAPASRRRQTLRADSSGRRFLRLSRRGAALGRRVVCRPGTDRPRGHSPQLRGAVSWRTLLRRVLYADRGARHPTGFREPGLARACHRSKAAAPQISAFSSESSRARSRARR